MTNYGQQIPRNNNGCFCINGDEPTCFPEDGNNPFKHLMLRMRNFWRCYPWGQQLAYDICCYSDQITRNRNQRKRWSIRSSYVNFLQTQSPEDLLPVATFISCLTREQIQLNEILQYLNFYLLTQGDNPFAGRHEDRRRVHRFLYREIIDPTTIMVWRFLWCKNINGIQFDCPSTFKDVLPAPLAGFFLALVRQGLTDEVIGTNTLRFLTQAELGNINHPNRQFLENNFDERNFTALENFPNGEALSQGLCCVLCNEIKRYTNNTALSFS